MKRNPENSPYELIYQGPHQILTSGPPGRNYTVRGMTYTAPLPQGAPEQLTPVQDGVPVPPRGNEPDGEGR
jgi:hypothetical protein